MIQSLALSQTSCFPLRSLAGEQLCMVVARAALRLDRESCTFYSSQQVKKLRYILFAIQVCSLVLLHHLHLGHRGQHFGTQRRITIPAVTLFGDVRRKKQELIDQWEKTVCLLLSLNRYSLGKQLCRCKTIAFLPSLVLPFPPQAHSVYGSVEDSSASCEISQP